MTGTTFVFGILLILNGLYGFATSDQEGAVKMTALIPSAIGVIFIIGGAIALKPGARKHAMHAVVTFALLGVIAAGGRLGMALAKGKALGHANQMQLIMLVLCGVYMVLAIRSFIAVRKAREAGEGSETASAAEAAGDGIDTSDD